MYEVIQKYVVVNTNGQIEKEFDSQSEALLYCTNLNNEEN